MQIIGEKSMQVYLEPLDKIKSTKILEMYEAAKNPAAPATADVKVILLSISILLKLMSVFSLPCKTAAMLNHHLLQRSLPLPPHRSLERSR